jgi:hypothetical protein
LRPFGVSRRLPQAVVPVAEQCGLGMASVGDGLGTFDQRRAARKWVTEAKFKPALTRALSAGIRFQPACCDLGSVVAFHDRSKFDPYRQLILESLAGIERQYPADRPPG